MLPFNLNIKHFLMEIPIPPGPPQPPHLILIELPPHKRFQLLPTNLFICFVLLRNTKPRLKPRLHADAHCCFERYRARIATDFDAPGGLGAFFDAQEGLGVAAACL